MKGFLYRRGVAIRALGERLRFGSLILMGYKITDLARTT